MGSRTAKRNKPTPFQSKQSRKPPVASIEPYVIIEQYTNPTELTLAFTYFSLSPSGVVGLLFLESRHFCTFSPMYRQLLIGPAVMIPLILWVELGQ